jgi:hypothetical protein
MYLIKKITLSVNLNILLSQPCKLRPSLLVDLQCRALMPQENWMSAEGIETAARNHTFVEPNRLFGCHHAVLVLSLTIGR